MTQLTPEQRLTLAKAAIAAWAPGQNIVDLEDPQDRADWLRVVDAVLDGAAALPVGRPVLRAPRPDCGHCGGSGIALLTPRRLCGCLTRTEGVHP